MLDAAGYLGIGGHFALSHFGLSAQGTPTVLTTVLLFTNPDSDSSSATKPLDSRGKPRRLPAV